MTTTRLVALIAVAHGACYHSPTKVLKSRSLKLTSSEPVQVGSGRKLTYENRTILVTDGPYCAPAKVGHYRLIEEERSLKKGDRKYAVLSMLTGLAAGGLGVFLASKPEGSGGMGIPLAILGGGMFLGFAPSALLPTTWTTELPPETQRAATFSETWQRCGAPAPAVAELLLSFTNGSDGFHTRARTGADGKYQLPPDLVRDLDEWSSLCGETLQMAITLVDPNQFTQELLSPGAVMDLRQRNNEGHEQVDEIRKTVAPDSLYLEIGTKAATSSAHLFLPGVRRTEITWKPTPVALNAPTGSSGATTFARACYDRRQANAKKLNDQRQADAKKLSDQNQADAKRRCEKALEPTLAAKCAPTCVVPGAEGKILKCKTAFDMCADMTAGIAQAREECTGTLNACRVDAGVDDDSIGRCVATCSKRLLAQGCP